MIRIKCINKTGLINCKHCRFHYGINLDEWDSPTELPPVKHMKQDMKNKGYFSWWIYLSSGIEGMGYDDCMAKLTLEEVKVCKQDM